jgi:anti-sigma B factor antagonist
LAGLDEASRSASHVDDELFSISLSFNGAVFAIELFGELDMAGAPELEQAIARAEETDAVTILVDLSALQFIDSSGIKVLLAESRRSTAATNRLHFLRGTGQVEKTLELCGLTERLPFLD